MKIRWFVFLGICFAASALAQVDGLAQTKPNVRLDTAIVKSLFFAGLQDKLSENYVKAAESFNRILAIDPNNAAVYFELATVNYRQNRMQEAEFAIKKATELETNNIWYWKFLVEMYKRKGDMNALITVFNELIRLDAGNDSYYYDRSNAWLLADKPEEAAKGYDELEKKFGPSLELTAARQRMTGKGEGEDKKLSKSNALEDLRKAKVLEPDNFELDLAIADAYKAQKNSVEANAALQNAFANPAMSPEQKIKIIMMLFTGTKNVQRMNDAKGLADIAVKAHPDDAAIKAVYAEVLYQQGDLQGSLKEFQGVLKITAQLYKAWEQILNIQIKLNAFKEAIKTADEALALYPNQGILYYYLAMAYKGNGQKAEALTQIKAALQLDVDNAVYKELYEGLK
ncbi:tetratricopeptide repeat protein [Pedobacter sp. JCM 36344]|uniref:tetratricopeptide repeat protein n=1 Tax=Pedobacter sp. JCM 36344 TaxID=3374280 RepID=UPI00397D9267